MPTKANSEGIDTMSETIDTARNTPRAVLHCAEHANPSAYEDDIETCEKALQPGGLAYIGHYTSGIFDFSVSLPNVAAGGSDPKGRQRMLERAGRQLGFLTVSLDATCQPLDSGPIIRMVVQGNTGTLFNYLKVPGQSLFGVAFGDDGPARLADVQMAAMAGGVAERMGVQTLDWGGFLRRQRSREENAATAPDPIPAAAEVAPHLWPSGTGVVRDWRSALCRNALSPRHLHYAGIFRNGAPLFFADILHDRALAHFFQRVTHEGRRRGYLEVARQVELHLDRLSRMLEVVGSSSLVRLVIDVAQGAIYFLPLGDGEWVVGVTLNQSRVDDADHAVCQLAAQIRQTPPSSVLPKA
jgi:hypothetical protein